MFALVGVINAINHSDGLDGLASGETMLSLIAIAFLGYLCDDSLLVGIALATIGGTLGFLRYNTHPARVFMGDAGSQFLGFTLGVLLIYLSQVAYTSASAALPLLLVGLPIADILAVLYLRISGGMNWFKATRNHIHHRLLGLGFSHFQTVVIIYSVQAALVVGAVLMRYQSDFLIGAAYFAVIAGLFCFLSFAERRNWKLDPHGLAASFRLPAPLQRLTDNKTLRSLPLMTITLVVPVFMLYGALSVKAIPSDFGAAASALAALVLTQMLRGRATGSVIMKVALYVTAAFSAYLLVTYPAPLASLRRDSQTCWCSFWRPRSEYSFAFCRTGSSTPHRPTSSSDSGSSRSSCSIEAVAARTRPRSSSPTRSFFSTAAR
ncbi:MAG: MraY family glycosyltransferase [Gammaproteobacteria bacterium]